jgi:predicted HTH transcriptional regulator
MIAEGESDELEFKSSVRWDYKQECVNKKLEEVILKSIAAFANGQGGTLLIGVDDKGTPLGLERDYNALDGAGRDKFERHIRNIAGRTFGESFVASKLHMTFPSVAGTEICQIEIGQAQQPMILKITDKSGVQAEKFYVRSGNSSVEMPLSEMHAFISDRFS